MPEDIRVESLNDDQMRDLNRLKAWLYQKRTTLRKDQERVERRQKKEKEAARKEVEQPALFDYRAPVIGSGSSGYENQLGAPFSCRDCTI